MRATLRTTQGFLMHSEVDKPQDPTEGNPLERRVVPANILTSSRYRKHGLSTEPFPVSAYVGSSKNLKDLKVARHRRSL